MTVLAPRLEPARRRTPLALIGSLALHGVLFGAGYLALHWAKPIRIGPSVPITLVATGPADLREADQAQTPVEAATPEPTPEATPAPVAPPVKAPPAPAPAAPKAAKTAAPPAKSPTARAPTPIRQGLDLDALAARLSARAGAGRATSSAARGRAQVAQAVVATPAVGAATGLTASALSALSSELNRLWSPNCEVEGGADVNVKVTFRIANDGRLGGRPQSAEASSPDPIVRAASDRAVRAVSEAAPFDNLPPDLLGQTFSVNFDARKACA